MLLRFPASATLGRQSFGALALLLFTIAAGAKEPRLNLQRLLPQLGYECIALRRSADNHLFCSGKLDGRRRSFLVDTGWSHTTVCRESEAEAGGREPWEFKLGPVTFTNQPAVSDRVIMGGKPAPFDVVLGLDFLRQHFAVIDCGANRLFTRRSPAKLEEAKDFAAALQRAGYVAIDLKVRDNLVLTCPGTLQGNSFELLVDSGAAWSCLDWRQAEAWGLKPLPSTTRLSGEGPTGTRGLALAEVKSLRLGDVEIPRASLGLVNLADWGLAREGQPSVEIKGLLGGELLAAYGAVIDCGAPKLWLKPRTRR